MTHWGLILSTLITATRFIVWPAIHERNLNSLFRRFTATSLIIIGIPLALCAAIISLPFLTILFIRNLFIRLISKTFFKPIRDKCRFDNDKITHKKLNIYRRYAGSLDVLQRSGTTEDRTALTDSDWVLIDDFIHDAWLAQHEQLSEPLIEQFETSIFSSCASISVVMKLRRMNWDDYYVNNKKGIFNKFLSWLIP